MSRAKIWASFEVTAEIACIDLFLGGISIISGSIKDRALVMLELYTYYAEQLPQDELSIIAQ